MQKKYKKKRKNWFSTLLSYADGREHRLWLSVILSIASIVSGIIPFTVFTEWLMHIWWGRLRTQSLSFGE